MAQNVITVEAVLALKDKLETGHAELSVDLEGDMYADRDNSNRAYEDLFAEVIGATKETSECIVLHFEGMPSVGFPIYHQLKVGSMVA